MEIQGPLTVEEMQQASVLSVPKLLRGSVLRRSQNTLNPSRLKYILMAVIVVFLLAQILRDPQISTIAKLLPTIFLVGIVAYQYFLGPKMARQGYERRIARIPRVLSVDPDGVRFEDQAKMFQFCPWSAYNSWREGSLIFLLRGPQRITNIIPKHGLSPQQIDALRVLLAMHMPDSA